MTLACLRCGHTWEPRKPTRPVRCPACVSPYWDKPRQATRPHDQPNRQRPKPEKP